MRILTVTSLYPTPLQPGKAPFNHQQLLCLSRKHAVSIITPVAWTEELAQRWQSGRCLPKERRSTEGTIAIEYPRYLFPPKVLRGWYGHFYRRSVRRAFLRAVTEFQPDLVYAPWAYPDGWATVSLAREVGLPVVVKVHGSDIHTLPGYPARRQGTVEAVCWADGVVAVSQDLANHVVALGAARERVRVVYDGVDQNRFHPGDWKEARARLRLSQAERVILFVGRLVPVKGIEVLLRACAYLAQVGMRFNCCIVGDGPLRSWLEQEVLRLRIQSHVHFLGPMPHDRLPDWYRAANVVALPSRSEGVPNVLLEAAACGTPFVASRVGGVPEIEHLGPNRLVPAGEVESFALAMARYLVGPPLREWEAKPAVRSMVDSAEELAELFTRTIESRRSGIEVNSQG